MARQGVNKKGQMRFASGLTLWQRKLYQMADKDIVPVESGGIKQMPRIDADGLQAIHDVNDVKQALAMLMQYIPHQENVRPAIDKLDEVNRLINQANEYGYLRAKYAALEAATLAEIARRGWQESIGHANTKKRKAAVWLAGLDESHYNDVLNLILNNSMTLITAWEAEMRELDKQATLYESIEQKHDVLKSYASNGYANMSWLGKGYGRSDIEKEIDAAVADSTRIALRKLGAVGIGDGKYVDPAKHPDKIDKGIQIRKSNLASCICKLFLYCQMSDGRNPFASEFRDAVRMTDLPIEAAVLWSGDDKEAKGEHDIEMDNDAFVAKMAFRIYKDIQALAEICERRGRYLNKDATRRIYNVLKRVSA